MKHNRTHLVSRHALRLDGSRMPAALMTSPGVTMQQPRYSVKASVLDTQLYSGGIRLYALKQCTNMYVIGRCSSATVTQKFRELYFQEEVRNCKGLLFVGETHVRGFVLLLTLL